MRADHWKWLLERPTGEMDDMVLPVVETPDLYQVVVVGGPVGKSLTFSSGDRFQPVQIANRAGG